MQLNLNRLRLLASLWYRDPSFYRMVIMLVALLAAGLLGPAAAQGELLPMMIIGLYYSAIAILIFLRWQFLGFPLIIVASLVVPFSIGTGTQTSINPSLMLVAFLLGLWILDMVAVKKHISLINSRTILPIGLFVLATLISFGFGQLLWFPTRGASLFAQLGGVSIFVLSAGAFVLAAHRLDTRWLQWMVWVFLIVSAIYIIGVLVPPLRRIVFRTYQRAVLDSLFWLWLTAMAFSQAFLNKRLHLGWRLALGVLAFAVLYITIIIKQAWTSGWLPATVSIMVILLLTRPKLSIVGGVVAGILLLIRSQVASSFLMAGDNEYSLLTRLAAWGILFEIIQLNPLFGVGPANYYFYTPFYNILGYHLSFNSHNNYIDIMAQTGVVGLGLFIWFAVEVGRIGLWLRKRVPQGFLTAFVYGTLGGLAGTLLAGMLGDWVLPFVYNIGMEGFRASVLAWLFLGALVMLEQKVRNHEIGPDD